MAIVSMHTIRTRIFDDFTRVFQIAEVPDEFIQGRSQACIANSFRALGALYTFTRKLRACSIQAVAIISQIVTRIYKHLQTLQAYIRKPWCLHC